MRIALDYDGTFTADPTLWTKFIGMAELAGHQVTCVTMRRSEDEAIEMPCPVVYTSRRAKKVFCDEHSIGIDVWIDDRPAWLFDDG